MLILRVYSEERWEGTEKNSEEKNYPKNSFDSYNRRIVSLDCWLGGSRSYLRVIQSDANSPPLPLKQPELASVRGRQGRRGDVTKVLDEESKWISLDLVSFNCFQIGSSLIKCRFLDMTCFKTGLFDPIQNFCLYPFPQLFRL